LLPYGLTEREIEVLKLAAEGLTNPAIGNTPFIAQRTEKGHLESVYNKLGVSSRAAAATKAKDLGIL
jgi:ATP/maltotriose-dependent transcriptional regulator MalT